MRAVFQALTPISLYLSLFLDLFRFIMLAFIAFVLFSYMYIWFGDHVYVYVYSNWLIADTENVLFVIRQSLSQWHEFGKRSRFDTGKVLWMRGEPMHQNTHYLKQLARKSVRK